MLLVLRGRDLKDHLPTQKSSVQSGLLSLLQFFFSQKMMGSEIFQDDIIQSLLYRHLFKAGEEREGYIISTSGSVGLCDSTATQKWAHFLKRPGPTLNTTWRNKMYLQTLSTTAKRKLQLLVNSLLLYSKYIWKKNNAKNIKCTLTFSLPVAFKESFCFQRKISTSPARLRNSFHFAGTNIKPHSQTEAQLIWAGLRIKTNFRVYYFSRWAFVESRSTN